MALNVGDRLWHYDVTALIGEGSTGRLYRGDTNLERPPPGCVPPRSIW